MDCARENTYSVDLAFQFLDLRHQLLLPLRLLDVQIQALLMGGDDGEVDRDRKDVAETPELEEVKRDVGVGLEEGLEGDETALDVLCAVPVGGVLLLAVVGPAGEEDLHPVHGLGDGVVGDVDNVIQEQLRREPEQFGEQDRRDRRWGHHTTDHVILEVMGLFPHAL